MNGKSPMQTTVPENPPTNPPGAPIRFKLVAGAMFLLVLALGFNALLTLSSLQKVYVSTIVSKYHVIGKNLQRDLEKATRFGKSIRKFHGIDRVLLEALDNLSAGAVDSTAPSSAGTSDITVSVVTMDRTIIYSTSSALKGRQPPEEVPIVLPEASAQKGTDDASHYMESGHRYFITLPINGGF